MKLISFSVRYQPSTTDEFNVQTFGVLSEISGRAERKQFPAPIERKIPLNDLIFPGIRAHIIAPAVTPRL